MQIKTSLKELGDLFMQSAADETLPVAERRFAAQCSILTMHLRRVEGTAARSINALGQRATAVEKILKDATETVSMSPPPPTNGATPEATAPVKGEIVAETKKEEGEEGEEDAALANFLAESEAEARAARAGAPPPKPPVALVPVDNKESA